MKTALRYLVAAITESVNAASHWWEGEFSQYDNRYKDYF